MWLFGRDTVKDVNKVNGFKEQQKITTIFNAFSCQLLWFSRGQSLLMFIKNIFS
jgi:hypothetical protein